MGIIVLFLEAISLVNKRWQSRPIFAAQMAVVLQWLLVAAPHAMIVSQFFSIASAIKNSSFLTLFPVKSVPVRSSLLIKHLTPSNPKSHGSIGVGPFAKIALIGYTGYNLHKVRKSWNQPFVEGTDTALGTHFGATHGRINLIIFLFCLLFASIFCQFEWLTKMKFSQNAWMTFQTRAGHLKKLVVKSAKE